MINFHEHQRRARRQTLLLIVLFTLAVLVLAWSLNVLLSVAYYLINPEQMLQPELAADWIVINLIVAVVVLGASFLRWQQLKEGGRAIAESVGGQVIDTDTADFYERRLLNVVEEIALAAHLPVPPVYLLPENSINAFAAGYHQTDAVIGVTRGAMEKLTRDQLQGVIAHEYSHILNGDMRINIRMMALIYGIVFLTVIGQKLLRTMRYSSRNRDVRGAANVLGMFGLGLIIIGYSGHFFGTLIKAAVSRQREYLADASAVQFTRNPKGIAGALKVIALEGSQVSGGGEASHFFFGDVRNLRLATFFSGWFSTHPPIDQRILRIEPRWRGKYLAAQTRPQAESEWRAYAQANPQARASLMGFAAKPLAAKVVQQAQTSGPEFLFDMARDAGLAPLLIYAMLMDNQDATTEQQQWQVLRNSLFAHSLSALPFTDIVQHLGNTPLETKLNLLELSIPSLKRMDNASYQGWFADVKALIEADGRITIVEWAVFRILSEYLQAHFQPRGAWAEFSWSDLTRYNKHFAETAAVLLYACARFGAQNNADIQPAFAAGCTVMGWEAPPNPAPQVNFKALNNAVDALKHTRLKDKMQLMEALKAVINYDQQHSDNEHALLRAISIAALGE